MIRGSPSGWHSYKSTASVNGSVSTGARTSPSRALMRLDFPDFTCPATKICNGSWSNGMPLASAEMRGRYSSSSTNPPL